MNDSALSSTVALAQALIRQPSITPNDNGCQHLLSARLTAIGFDSEHLRFGDVANLWARRGHSEPLFVFAGHTDVVPIGAEGDWSVPPFSGEIRDGRLWGRGAADMKGSLAAMVTACERFVDAHPQHRGSIALLVTSDEEGPALDGTRRVVEQLLERNEIPSWCLVGEPTSNQHLGDVIKIGRRGSINGTITILGTQGHVAYPQLADNPIHRAGALIAALAAHRWDDAGAGFPASRLQISNINGGTGADNVIPGSVQIRFNVRFSAALSPAAIDACVHGLCRQHDLRYTLEWSSPGLPYRTDRGELVETVSAAIRSVTGTDTTLSTDGGTSDGRFIAPMGTQVVELGPCNATIHKVDEHVEITHLDGLSAIYERILKGLLD